MKTVAIGFSRPKKWKPVAWLIMKIDRTDFSHSFVSWKCEEIQRRKVFEAVGTGIRIIGNTQFKKKAYVVNVYSFEVPDDTLIWLEQYAHDQSGKPYGYKHLIGLGYMKLLSFVGIKVKNPFKDGEYSQICLESGAYIMEKFLGQDLLGEIEDYSLAEFESMVAALGSKAPQEKLDRINRNG